jgi:hypothetical protein
LVGLKSREERKRENEKEREREGKESEERERRTNSPQGKREKEERRAEEERREGEALGVITGPNRRKNAWNATTTNLLLARSLRQRQSYPAAARHCRH